MTNKFTPQLERDVCIRDDTSDSQTWTDTFDIGYHVPPEITPDAVLDLGANIGLTAAHYAVMWPDAEVVAVEMDEDNAEVCRRNFDGLVVTVAVGAHTGYGSYQKSGWQASYSLVNPGDTQTRVLTISELIDDCLLEADSIFCKMDAEGAEWDIFAEGIDQRVRWLLVELHGGLPAEEMLSQATSLLEADGFSVQRHEIHPHALWAVR